MLLTIPNRAIDVFKGRTNDNDAVRYITAYIDRLERCFGIGFRYSEQDEALLRAHHEEEYSRPSLEYDNRDTAAIAMKEREERRNKKKGIPKKIHTKTKPKRKPQTLADKIVTPPRPSAMASPHQSPAPQPVIDYIFKGPPTTPKNQKKKVQPMVQHYEFAKGTAWTGLINSKSEGSQLGSARLNTMRGGANARYAFQQDRLSHIADRPTPTAPTQFVGWEDMRARIAAMHAAQVQEESTHGNRSSRYEKKTGGPPVEGYTPEKGRRL